MGVEPAEVRIYKYEPVIWEDGRGCPEYSGPLEQVNTPGSWVLIEAGRHMLDYRTDDLRNRVLLCEVHPIE